MSYHDILVSRSEDDSSDSPPALDSSLAPDPESSPAGEEEADPDTSPSPDSDTSVSLPPPPTLTPTPPPLPSAATPAPSSGSPPSQPQYLPLDSAQTPPESPETGPHAEPLPAMPVLPYSRGLYSGKAILYPRDWRLSLPPEVRMELARQIQNALDPAAEQRRIAIIVRMAEQTEADLNRINSDYETARAGYAARKGWDEAGSSDDALFAHMQVEARADEAHERFLIGVEGEDAVAAATRATSAASMGYSYGSYGEFQNVVPAYTQWYRQHERLPGFDRSRANDYYSLFAREFARGQQDLATARRAARAVFPILAAHDTGADPHDALPFLRPLSDEQRFLIAQELERLTSGIPSTGPDGLNGKAALAFWRGGKNLFTSLKSLSSKVYYSHQFREGEPVERSFLERGIGPMAEEMSRRHAAPQIMAAASSGTAGPAVFQPPPLSDPVALTAAQAADANAWVEQRLQDERMVGRLRAIADGTASPLKGGNFFENGVIHLSEAAPSMLAMAVPGGWLPVTMAWTNDAEEVLHQGGLPPETARAWAPFVGGLQALAMRFSLGFLRGTPALNRLINSASTSALKRALLRAGTGSVLGGLDMGAQSVLVPALAHELARAFDDRISPQDLEQINGEFWSASVQGMVDMMPLFCLGAGRAHAADVRRADTIVRDPVRLRVLGFQEEQITAILHAAPGKAVEALSGLWKTRRRILKGDPRGAPLGASAGFADVWPALSRRTLTPRPNARATVAPDTRLSPAPAVETLAPAQWETHGFAIDPAAEAPASPQETKPAEPPADSPNDSTSAGESPPAEEARPSPNGFDSVENPESSATETDPPAPATVGNITGPHPVAQALHDELRKRQEAAALGIRIFRDDDGWHLQDNSNKPLPLGDDPALALHARDQLLAQKKADQAKSSTSQTEDGTAHGDSARSPTPPAPDSATVPPSPETSPSFGAGNTLFTRAMVERSRQAARATLTKLGAGQGPLAFTFHELAAASQYAGFLIEGGVRKFPDWSRAMLKFAGERVRPHLRGLYENLRRYPANDWHPDMTPAHEVAASTAVRTSAAIENDRRWLRPTQRSQFAAEATASGRPPATTLEELNELARLVNQEGIPAILQPETVNGGPVTNPGWQPGPGGRKPKEKGHWDKSGTPGNTAWYSDIPEINALTGDQPIQFREGNVDLDPYAILEYSFDNLKGTKQDFKPADVNLAKVIGLNSSTAAVAWRTAMDLCWHHHHDGRTLQLVPFVLNDEIPHVGGASHQRK